jgi:N-acyl amino acid synthase of PEP-CTERM/exosortase system
MGKMDLVAPYRDYFRMIPADTAELKKEVYRIRYGVYCEELGWEEKSAFPDGLEFDSYDHNSRHCLLQYQKDDSFIGCVRLVLADPDTRKHPIPLIEHCPDMLDPEILDINSLNRDSFGEISRLAIKKEFRRRPGESDSPSGFSDEGSQPAAEERRRFPHIALGLYLGAASIGIGEGLSGVFAMMEPRLARVLKILGIHFQQVGKALEYRGTRAPFYISRESLFQHLRPELQVLLEAIEEDLGILDPLSS